MSDSAELNPSNTPQNPATEDPELVLDHIYQEAFFAKLAEFGFGCADSGHGPDPASIQTLMDFLLSQSSCSELVRSWTRPDEAETKRLARQYASHPDIYRAVLKVLS